MDEKKLIIQAHKYSGENTIVSVRLPKDMLADIDAVASKTGRTRSEIMLLSLEFALKHMEIQ
ncbi:MAG: ribbon-helix-helix domain-containing protein [Clostridiales bacterium]|nr:ribbon-helix-helix domain-containing protein [Oscillospiraceae bacterium]MCD8383407.1 ribbon-helix-helix domain-containing protein [Clostridiales bacterium]